MMDKKLENVKQNGNTNSCAHKKTPSFKASNTIIKYCSGISVVCAAILGLATGKVYYLLAVPFWFLVFRKTK
ncbi:MAG: hypothetical protein GY710_05655 [Desulfobacteraceae bacterium]|nr:hypothetical protein [Desulfobacteraceae bacterium]